MYWLPYSCHTSHHPSQTACLPWISYATQKTDARFMQDSRKAVLSIPYIFVSLFPSSKYNSIAYRSSKVSSRPDCLFEIHQLWQSGFSRVYSNCYCSYSFKPEIIKIGQSSHKMYSNNNFQEYVNFKCLYKKVLLNSPRIYIYIKSEWRTPLERKNSLVALLSAYRSRPVYDTQNIRFRKTLSNPWR